MKVQPSQCGNSKSHMIPRIVTPSQKSQDKRRHNAGCTQQSGMHDSRGYSSGAAGRPGRGSTGERRRGTSSAAADEAGDGHAGAACGTDGGGSIGHDGCAIVGDGGHVAGAGAVAVWCGVGVGGYGGAGAVGAGVASRGSDIGDDESGEGGSGRRGQSWCGGICGVCRDEIRLDVGWQAGEPGRRLPCSEFLMEKKRSV